MIGSVCFTCRRKIAGNVVGKLRARSYCSPAQVPAQVSSRPPGALFIGSLVCGSCACWFSIQYDLERPTTPKARVPSHEELERDAKAGSVLHDA